ncbi:TANK-binding kinase 1-binding protein 1 isoform X2 [Hemiscyllium ocellatum]|uniref:TANK-binding kinase 1-binding protein 1 isoform X2 n=1 Tax=Hemiscyllium ocellatum TaxID=170820 RepID=UPI002965FDBA|nr:TANK-binding kinase 1-binding protein 1 isoform X2 [Hemiscyllium ocellatum]
MDSFNYEDDISILTQNGQQDDTEWADAPNTDLTGEEYSASHYALITAYNDIKQRLIGMERDNSTLKRKLRQYDLKLRDCKEREDHLDEVIKAYEKIRSEKDDLHQQLEEMTVLAEDHISTIQSLEQALRLRDSSVQILNDQLQAKNEQIIQLSPTRRSPYGLESPRHQQNCRVVDPQLDELEVQRLQEKVDELQRKLHSCQWRERQYKEECDRLQSQLSQQSLQESCAQEPSHDPHDMEWIKNTEEEQENLVLAYTELAQELCQLRSLTEAQTEILRRLSEEQLTNNAHLQPSGHVRQVAYSSYPRSTSHRLRTNFQGRRSYSEVSDAKVESHTMPSRLPADDQTSPTHRQYLANDYLKVPDSPDIGPFERQIESEDEDWMNHSPPGTLDRGIRSTSSCTALPIPDTTMKRSSTEYSRSEHAQSWPSINLWMETGDSDIRSCPLCQLAFPLNYPDDALIKHIDTHLENSKI